MLQLVFELIRLVHFPFKPPVHPNGSQASPVQIDKHRKCFGENRLPPKRRKWWLEHFWDSVTDLTLMILMVGATISIIFGAVTGRSEDQITGVAILIAVFVVAGTTSTVNYVQEAQFQALSKVKEDRPVLVIRGGEEVTISVYDVVVGDVFVIKAGELLPCDGLLLSGSGIKCDESAMTGESLEIAKNEQGDVFMVGGSQVTSGAGRMLVLTTGDETSYGVIVKALEDVEPPPTPLQEKLTKLASNIGYVGMATGAFNLIILIILFYSVDSRRVGKDEAITVLSFFLLSVTIVVVAVPEGLPMAVILSLAFSMKRMIKDKLLVRKLNSVETMGSATCICSDKTGTLTENRMTVTAGRFLTVQSITTAPSSSDVNKAAGEAALGTAAQALLAAVISLNSDASVKTKDNVHAQNADAGRGPIVDFVGNKTEGAMLLMLQTAMGIDYNAVRREAGQAAGRGDGVYFIHRENFNSSRKRMTTVISTDVLASVLKAQGASVSAVAKFIPGLDNAAEYPAILLTKGAAEIVLGYCDKEAQITGGFDAIDTERRALLQRCILEFASSGLRTLALASTPVSKASMSAVQALIGKPRPQVAGQAPPATEMKIADINEAWEIALDAPELSIERNLTMVGIVGIRDPPRPEVPAAVAACKRSLVKVRMVTGDNVDTARAIAKEVGIFTGGVVMEGREWREMSQEQRLKIVVDLDVLARAIPTDKLLLVQALQELGETVAVTGDGSNDAPALNAAHVGCAMGIAGTEVAKEAVRSQALTPRPPCCTLTHRLTHFSVHVQADLIILDDNFSSLVNAILWGRAVLENIRKFLTFQLVVNISACILTVIMAILEGGSVTNFPLTPIQLLWINLIMDSFAALALATEPPDKALLKQRPEGRHSPLISKIMWKMIFGQAAFQTALLLFLSLSDAGAKIYDPAVVGLKSMHAPVYVRGSREHLCSVFNTFVFLTLFNKFNARKLHDEFNILRE